MTDEPDSLRTSNDVRFCLTLLIGISYADPKLSAYIKTITPHRDRLPRDLVLLLEAVEKQDGSAVETWFRDVKHIALENGDGAKLPLRLAGFLLRHHWRQVAHQTIGGMAKVIEMPVGELLAGMKRLVAELENAGIVPTDKPE